MTTRFDIWILGDRQDSTRNQCLEELYQKLGGLFVRGKFDLNLQSQPYSGITAACAKIWSQTDHL
jgi:hypothetical protein